MFRAFTCLRKGCGLPLHAHHEDGAPDRLLHVHAVTTEPDGALRLTLARGGRNGCTTPCTTAP